MSDKPDALMVFAAGLGTRMGALTAQRPKPLIEVAGKPLIDYALDLAGDAGIPHVVVNTHYLSGMLETHLDGIKNVSISRETPDLLDTGGGLRKALPMLGHAPLFTLNSDAVWSGLNPLSELASAWDAARMDALLLLVPRCRAQSHKGPGDFLLGENGHVTRGGAGHIYTGAQIIRTDGLASIPETTFSLNLLWDSMLVDQRIFGVVHDGGWCDVGHPSGISTAETWLADQPDV